jgi:3-methylcrotonyl-CoA carboxylase alpha subunit
MFKKILIANRGEIACRIAATARRLGIRTVAVYSDADARARHVAACDEAYRLGPAPARESYLRGDAIIAIAQRAGAQAVHPGYGFLSENEDFAQAVADAGLVFIGPPPSAIRAMGLKAESKRLMAQAGVPLVPGYHDPDQDPALLAREADRIGYPVLIKASAGGGGKGMRIVWKAEEFDAMLASCKREAKASFGDDAVLIERYVTRPRHIEIQVFGDRHGQCVYLFERDCSVQRRHQKVIEEAPAPGMSAERRRAMGEAAVSAARAVGYVGAGTVEFIAEPDGTFYFMEMNTRLQVEHPVTEMITRLDLVEWQLRVAAGQPLPLGQERLQIRGHAIEARIYAENPDKGFLPSTGRLVHQRTPEAVHFTHVGAQLTEPAAVRIDSGVREGDTISPFYDPMIAKLIVWGADRAQAIDRMRMALAGFEVVGPTTNIAFLGRLMACRAFREADLDTALIERERSALFPGKPAPGLESLAIAGAAVLARETADTAAGASRTTALGGFDPADPWSQRSGWRLNGALVRRLSFEQGEASHALAVEYARGGYTVRRGEAEAVGAPEGEPDAVCLADVALEGARLTGLAGDRAFAVSAVFVGESLHLFDAGAHHVLHYAPPLAHAGDDAGEGGRLTAPMPGKVIALLVDKGAKVRKAQPLVVMEAMKMEHTIAAPADGETTELLYAVGDQVAEGAQLIGFTAH